MVSKRFKQDSFQVFTGRDQPFNTAETKEIQTQVLRVMVSAGLPFQMYLTDFRSMLRLKLNSLPKVFVFQKGGSIRTTSRLRN
jgi:hypothetical protein